MDKIGKEGKSRQKERKQKTKTCMSEQLPGKRDNVGKKEGRNKVISEGKEKRRMEYESRPINKRGKDDGVREGREEGGKKSDHGRRKEK